MFGDAYDRNVLNVGFCRLGCADRPIWLHLGLRGPATATECAEIAAIPVMASGLNRPPPLGFGAASRLIPRGSAENRHAEKYHHRPGVGVGGDS